ADARAGRPGDRGGRGPARSAARVAAALSRLAVGGGRAVRRCVGAARRGRHADRAPRGRARGERSAARPPARRALAALPAAPGGGVRGCRARVGLVALITAAGSGGVTAMLIGLTAVLAAVLWHYRWSERVGADRTEGR